MRRHEVLLASGNINKYSEIAQLMAPLGIDLIFGPERGSLDVEETGDSYIANALLKARAWAEATGLPALADDSGLEVRALQWRPGIYSSRIAENDELRNRWVLDNLEHLPDRTARFVAAFALVFPERGEILTTEGCCWGRIAENPVGTAGFGYDPIFVPDGYNGTFGELGEAVKQRISHRTRACNSLMDMLKSTYVVE